MAQLTWSSTKPAVGDPTKQSFASQVVDNDELNRYITMTNGDAGSHTVTQVVYVSAADTVKLADADAAATADGIAFAIATILTTAAGKYQTHGVLGGFAGLTAGSKYYVSATAGAITSTKPTTNPCFVGIAITTTQLSILPRGVLLITTAEIADDAVTLAKLAAGTAGNLITYDASGNPAAVATGTSGQVLTSNGAGAAPTMQASASEFKLIEQVIRTAGNVSTTSATYVDVTGMTSTQTWSGGKPLIVVQAFLTAATASVCYITANIAGTDLTGASGNGLGEEVNSTAKYRDIFFVHLDNAALTGSVTIKLRFRNNDGVGVALNANANRPLYMTLFEVG